MEITQKENHRQELLHDKFMKTLINKTNPTIRITAPEILENTYLDGKYGVPYCDFDNESCMMYLDKNLWTLVEEEQQKILDVFGFKVGDAVRLKDGDGRKHIIKSFEEVEGIHGPNFYHVEFEDNSARDSICLGDEYPSGYYTQMEKFEEEPKEAILYLNNGGKIGMDEWLEEGKRCYEKGKADNELSWEDLQKLDIIANKLWQDGKYDKNDAQEFYTEVLRRFCEYKEQKNK